jgi:hypothetical protein
MNGRHVKQELRYMDYVTQKTMNVTRIFGNDLQVQKCILGIKLKPQGSLRQKVIGEAHYVNCITL